MSAIEPVTRLVRDPDLIAADMDGDLVMLSIERGEYFGVGGVGTRVWELLEQPASVDDLTAAICAEYEVDEATCRADMSRFAEELLRLGLVKPA